MSLLSCPLQGGRCNYKHALILLFTNSLITLRLRLEPNDGCYTNRPIFMNYLPLLLWIAVPTTSSAFIDKFANLVRLPAGAVCRFLGDVHDHDRHNHRATIVTGVKKRIKVAREVENPKPLTIYVEDPTVLPGIEKLIQKKGVLPGLVQELNELDLPKNLIVKNFDQRKFSSCLLKWLHPSAIPYAFTDAPHLKDYTFGDVVNEVEGSLTQNETRIKEYITPTTSSWVKNDLTNVLAQIKTSFDAFKNKLHDTQISLSDSILHTGIKLFADDVVNIPEYAPYAAGKNKQGIIALLQEGAPSDMPTQSLEEIPRFYNPASKRSLTSKPLYDASVALASTDAFFSVIGTKGNSALIAGSTHTDDVSGWMINSEEWGEHPADVNFSDNWLANASLDELEAAYSNK